MGELLATLPLDQVAQIAARLDQAVLQARRERDPRTADQVRADTLTDLLTHGLVPGSQASGLHTSTDNRTAEADTAPAPHVDDLEGRPATRTRTNGEPQSTGDSTTDTSSDTTSSSSSSDTSRSGSHAPVPRPISTHVLVTITLETLLGLRDDPGRLDRYGPIAADLARDLAANGIWRCAAIDDTHGTLLGLGRSTYTPRYSPGTRLTRLQHAAYPCSLCRRHHRMKTLGHVELQPSVNPDHPPGTWLWRLPTGRTYTSRPEPLLPLVTLVTLRPRQAPARRTRARPAAEPPPF
jgi:hypothetical protein